MTDPPADAGHIDRGETFEIDDEMTTVTVTKIFTPKGERLELRAEDGSYSRVDAIELECLSWQDSALFADLAAADVGPDDVLASSAASSGPSVRVSNEYSEVCVTRIDAGGGDALRIESKPLHYENALRPIALRAVVGADPSLFSDLLDQPYGPMID